MLISVNAWWPSYTNTKTYFELEDIRSIGSKPLYEVGDGARVWTATLSRRHGILSSPAGAFFNCRADNCFIIEVTSVSVIDEGWGSLGATGLFHNIWPNLDPIVAKNTEGERGWGETARWTCCTNLKHHNWFLNYPSRKKCLCHLPYSERHVTNQNQVIFVTNVAQNNNCTEDT